MKTFVIKFLIKIAVLVFITIKKKQIKTITTTRKKRKKKKKKEKIGRNTKNTQIGRLLNEQSKEN